MVMIVLDRSNYTFDNRRMHLMEKKITCQVDGQSDSQLHVNSCSPSPLLGKYSACDFKLDKIYPKHIQIRFNQKENQDANQINHKPTNNSKTLNSTENKFYHQYLNLKNMQSKHIHKKSKISHIFSIRSINLVEKAKIQRPEANQFKKLNIKSSYKDVKKHSLEKVEKQKLLKHLNLILIDKQLTIEPQYCKRLVLDRKNSSPFIHQKIQPRPEYKSSSQTFSLKLDNSFEGKLAEYYKVIKESCDLHHIQMKEVENYPKNSLSFYVGKGNNRNLIKEMLKKRWWWSIVEEKNKKTPHFTWTQLKEKDFYLDSQNKPVSSPSQYEMKRSTSVSKSNKEKVQPSIQEVNETKMHNHFESNEYLGNKKALYYNMKAYYESKGEEVFNYLPVTFHVKKMNDQAWMQFQKYYFVDLQKGEGGKRLWIVKPGENTNRGSGITIHTDLQKIRKLIVVQDQNPDSKKTFIIQKYIDEPFLYNKRKFDIRCYMLLVRLNGTIKAYWYQQGYIRTSCYEFHLNDCQNQFVHLTNDAIQINSDKYGKYEDGNKLSYHAFQKYLDANFKEKHSFVDEICPQLKKIGKDSIEATYHLLGKWDKRPTFEIFGLDFMIDSHFKPWLIQINTNPCLETSSSTLERVIPRMLDNAFKLSLDVLFPPPQAWLNSKKHYLPNRAAYNLFELMFDEENSEQCHTVTMQDIVIEMGEIEQDNEIYEEDEKLGGKIQLTEPDQMV